MAIQVIEYYPGIWVDLKIGYLPPRDPSKRAEILSALVKTFKNTNGVTMSVDGATVRVAVPVGTTFESLADLRAECQTAIDDILSR